MELYVIFVLLLYAIETISAATDDELFCENKTSCENENIRNNSIDVLEEWLKTLEEPILNLNFEEKILENSEPLIKFVDCQDENAIWAYKGAIIYFLNDGRSHSRYWQSFFI